MESMLLAWAYNRVGE